MEAPWRIQMFGGLRAQRGERAVEHFRTQKTGSLLAYLACHSERAHPREVLIELLWPGVEPETGRHNLSLALSALRDQFEPAGVPSGSIVKADRSTVQLNPDAIETDVAQFDAALKAAAEADNDADSARHRMAAVELYRGELLSGYYDNWIVKEQRRLADIYYQSVRQLAAHFEQTKEWERALDYARRAVAVNPLNEDAHQDLMRLLLAAGQPFAALRQFRELERILKEELEVEPSPKTLKVLREIEAQAKNGLAMFCEASLSADQRRSVDEFATRHRRAVLALLFTDIEQSTRLMAEMGEAPAMALFERHNAILRGVLAEFSEAQEVLAAGDSFFLIFANPSDSVRFALRAQRQLRELAAGERPDFRVHMGIHLGEVVVGEKGEGGPVEDVMGMQVAIAARVTALAAGGQILMTSGVFDNARTILKGEHLAGIAELSWLNHGPYRLKGLEEAVTVCEVGETAVAPLQPPPDSDAGKRTGLPGTEPILGWRPAVEQAVPNTQWVLEEKLGEGGFGEVWRARHRHTKGYRVFKFCFRADRLRNLKREMTLFRLLKEVLGERSDVARLYNVQFEEAPYYLEMEDTPGGNLAEWIEAQGGFENVPLESRLEIVAQIATALAAAHSVGVIHKDVKPTNVLVEERAVGPVRQVGPVGQLPHSIQIRLTDFGIGQLIDRQALERAGVTAAGFTETASAMTELSSRTGTRLYMAPELLAGRPPSIQSDIYSLGVLLYQLVIGDLTQPMTTDWERHVRDPLLRDDLHHCLAGDPSERFASATDVARRLRALPRRRMRRRMTRLAQASVFLLLILLIAAGAVSLVRARNLKREIALRREAERQLYLTNIRFAASCIEQLGYRTAREALAACPEHLRNWEWGRLQYLCNLDLLTLTHESAVSCVDFSPDGKRLLTGSDDKTARIWDAETGRQLLALTGHDGHIVSVSFSPDGRRILTAAYDAPGTTESAARRVDPTSHDYTARIWDAETGRELLQLRGHTLPLTHAAFSPDGRRVVTTSDDTTARIWDAETGAQLLTLKGHGRDTQWAAFSPDGRRVVTGSLDKTARIWDTETGRQVLTLKGHKDGVWCATFSPDGRQVATGSLDKTAKIWNAETGREILSLSPHTPKVHGEVYGVAFSRDGRIVTASLDRTARIWDAETGRELLQLSGHSLGLTCAAFSPDGRTVLTASHDKTAKLWDTEGRRDVLILRGHEGRIARLTFSPDGQRVATTGIGDPTARVWDIDTGRVLFQLFDRFASVSVVFPADSRQLVTASSGTARIWDIERGQQLLTLLGHSALILSVAVSPDDRLVATSSENGEVKIGNARTGEELRMLRGHSTPVHTAAFSPDSQRVVTAGADATARIWEIATGHEIVRLIGHGETISSAAFSPDGLRVVTASLDGTARIWEATTGRELLTFKAHEESVQYAAFSPDGRRVVSSSLWVAFPQTTIWDAETGNELLTVEGNLGLWYRPFSPDGRRIATRSLDGRVLVYESLPWRNEDLPGDVNMSDDERIQLWKRDRRRRTRSAGLSGPEETSPRVVAWVPYLLTGKAGEAREMDSCAANLRKIHAALVRYQNDHGGEMPYWLSDLVPNYITSDILLCPSDPEGVAFYSPDPRLPCSYGFQFSPFYSESQKKTYREWKTEQLKEFGDIVPTARCYSHTKILNLSYGGKLFLTPQGVTWETGPREDYISGKTAITSGSLTSSPKKSDTAITGTAPPKP